LRRTVLDMGGSQFRVGEGVMALSQLGGGGPGRLLGLVCRGIARVTALRRLGRGGVLGLRAFGLSSARGVGRDHFPKRDRVVGAIGAEWRKGSGGEGDCWMLMVRAELEVGRRLEEWLAADRVILWFRGSGWGVRGIGDSASSVRYSHGCAVCSVNYANSMRCALIIGSVRSGALFAFLELLVGGGLLVASVSWEERGPVGSAARGATLRSADWSGFAPVYYGGGRRASRVREACRLLLGCLGPCFLELGLRIECSWA